MSWVDAAAYAEAEPDPLAGAAAAIIQHMNADHAEAQVLFCRHFVGRPDSTEAIMSAVDRYGFEMIVISPAGRAAVRLGFAEECTTGDQVRQAMVALVANARAAPLLSPSSLATPEPDTQYLEPMPRLER
jgi:putative heme iron utilization protein